MNLAEMKVLDPEGYQLIVELENLMKPEVATPIPKLNFKDYVWTPPEIIKNKAISNPLTNEDFKQFERLERQIEESREWRRIKDDPLYDSIQKKEIDPNLVDKIKPEPKIDMGFQQEMTQPSWFQKNILRKKPKAIGQEPQYGIGEGNIEIEMQPKFLIKDTLERPLINYSEVDLKTLKTRTNEAIEMTEYKPPQIPEAPKIEPELGVEPYDPTDAFKRNLYEDMGGRRRESRGR